jgi:hypothetical protein
MKQTSVEYLVEQLKEYDFSPRDNTFLIEIPLWIWKEKVEQAKEMEKQQIVDFGYDIAEDLAWGKYRDKKAMEERYNEYLTYNEEEEE